MDTSQTERTEELFDKESAVLRSQSKSESIRYGSAKSGGLTGVKANLPESAEAPVKQSDERSPKDSKISETKNYEVNRVLNRVTEDPIKLKRLHIAILINGALEASTSSAAGTLMGNEVGGRNITVNLQRIAALAREAAGLDMERGDRLEVHSIPFAGENVTDEGATTASVAAAPPPAAENVQLIAAAAGAAMLLVAVALFAMMRSKKKKELEAERKAAELAAASVPAPVAGIAPKTTRERVRDAVRQDSERAARILSAWLRENEETA
jgi:flagellar M-ring protein FliF